MFCIGWLVSVSRLLYYAADGLFQCYVGVMQRMVGFSVMRVLISGWLFSMFCYMVGFSRCYAADGWFQCYVGGN